MVQLSQKRKGKKDQWKRKEQKEVKKKKKE